MSIAIDLDGRTCLVVGGAGGRIGSAITRAAADAGAAVGIITHNTDHAATAVDDLGATAEVVDVEDESALVGAIARIGQELGPIRYLVNVVGGAMGECHRAAELDLSTVDRVVARNLRYAIVSCREVGAALLARGESGSIVNVSSVAASGRPLLGAYSVAKAGLEAYSRSAAPEWAPHGIRVNVLSCGAIRTATSDFRASTVDNRPLTHESHQRRGDEVPSIPLRRRGQPSEVANAAVFLLSDLAGYTTGATLQVDGGVALGHPGGDALSSLADTTNMTNA